MRAWHDGGYPLTKAVIAINFITLLLITFRVPIIREFLFIAPESLRTRPWTLLTYPFLSADIFGFFMLSLWIWWAGGALERSWGTRYYAVFFASVAVVSALGLTLGSYVLHDPFVGVANWLPVAAIVIAFCALNPWEGICLWPVGTIQARWLAVAVALVVFFVNAQGSASPLMGFFALIGCGASYAWVTTRSRSRGYYPTVPTAPSRVRTKQVPVDDKFTLRDLNPLERIARAKRKKQFERLMRDD